MNEIWPCYLLDKTSIQFSLIFIFAQYLFRLHVQTTLSGEMLGFLFRRVIRYYVHIVISARNDLCIGAKIRWKRENNYCFLHKQHIRHLILIRLLIFTMQLWNVSKFDNLSHQIVRNNYMLALNVCYYFVIFN